MNERSINFELQGRVRKYMEFINHKETNSEKEGEIVNHLNKALKKEIFLEYNGKNLYGIPFLRENFSSKSIEELSFLLEKMTCVPEEIIFHVLKLNKILK